MKLLRTLTALLLSLAAVAVDAQTFVHDADSDIALSGTGRGICKKGALLYAVVGNKTIYRYDLTNQTGETIISGLSSVYDVAVANDGTIYIALGQKVAIYNADCTKNREITFDENVYGVTIGPDGKLYVASYSKVTIIDSADNQQVVSALNGVDKFRQVQKVCFDDKGVMYICDYNTGVMRVTSITDDTANIELRIKRVDNVDTYNRLAYMTVLHNGHMMVTVNRSASDGTIYKVYDFMPDGTLYATYEGDDVAAPWGIVGDDDDNVYLVDSNAIKFWRYSDQNAPEVTAVALSNITRTSVDFSFACNEKATLYWKIDAADAQPTADQLLASASIAVTTANALTTHTLDSPTANSLRLYYMAVDAAGNQTAVLSTEQFSTMSELVLQYLIPTSKTAEQTVMEFAANAAGTLYYVVKPADAAAASPTELLAGTAISYATAGRAASFTVPAQEQTARSTVYALLTSGSDQAEIASCTVSPYGDIDVVRQRYLDLMLGSDVDYANAALMSRYKALLNSAKTAHGRVGDYDPDAEGLTEFDVDESNSPNDIVHVRELVGSVLFPLAMAYNIEGTADYPNEDYHNPNTLAEILKLYRYLSVRNFKSGRELHFKGGGIYLRLTGYFYASMLMRTELQRAGMLDEVAGMMAWATRWVVPGGNEIAGGESDWTCDATGNPSRSDGVRTIYNNRLMYLLTVGDAETTREEMMAYLVRCLDFAFTPKDAWDGFLKPDYTGYHHNGPWGNSYSTNAMAIAAQMAYLLRGTQYAVDDASVGHIAKALEAYAHYSGKYDITRGLCGRFPNQLRNIATEVRAYAYIYEALAEGELKASIGGIFANLYDPDYSLVKSKLVNNVACEIVFAGGMGSLQLCNALKSATTATTDYALNRTFPFAAMQIHRRNDWLVTVKGYSKYVWDFETNQSENWYGRNQSLGQLAIYSGKDAEGVVGAEASGVGYNGYDWSHIPGVTAPALSLSELLTDAKNFPYPRFSNEAFASGVSDGSNGAYGFKFSDHSTGQSQSNWTTRVTALKSYFFFDDVVVALASDIDNTNSSYDSHTTLVQNLLPTADTPITFNGESVTGLSYSHDVEAEGPATLTDIAGNSYYIANAKGLHLQRSTQTSRDDKDASDTSGDYFTAWINHGSATTTGSYEYAVTVRGGQAAGKPDYTVVRCDNVAHIVSLGRRRGIVAFAPETAIGDELVAQTTEPCAIWIDEASENGMTLTVANPDLGYYPKGNAWGCFPVQCWSIASSRQFAASEVQPVEVSLAGYWKIATANDKVEMVGYDANTATTTLRFNGINAESLTIALEKETTGIDDIAMPQRLTVTPTLTKGPITIASASATTVDVRVIDLCGRTVMTVAAGGGATVDADLSALAAGHYFVCDGLSTVRVVKR